MNPSTPDNKWPEVLRIVWLSGGLVAINEPGSSITIREGLKGQSILKLQIKTYSGLFVALQSVGFHLIGCGFYTDQEEITGWRTPDFRACGSTDFVTHGAWDKWSQISHAAANANDMRLTGVAGKIASGLLYCEYRLLDLCAAYSAQLAYHLRSARPKEYRAFQDMHNHGVIRAIHALFWEMAVLRDSLAEFAALHCFSETSITTLSGLMKILKKHPHDPIAVELSQATDQTSGWLARFTDYRNCFTHVAPLAQAANSKFAVQDMKTIKGEVKVPQIYYPLPEDAAEIIKRKSDGVYVKSMEELIALLRRRHDRKNEVDALEYLHDCLNRMADLADRLHKRSPIAPVRVHFTDKDFIGPVKVL